MKRLKKFIITLICIFYLNLYSQQTIDLNIKTNAPKELCESIQDIFNKSTKNINITLYELYKFILDRKIDIKIKDKNGNTALHFAAQNGLNNVIMLLVKLGANIDARAREVIMPDWEQIKNDGKIPIKYPKLNETNFDQLEGFFIAKYVIEKYLSQKNRKACKFKNLFDKNKDEIIPEQPFTKKDIIQLTISNCSPLHDAICNGHFETVRLLIELGADINVPIEHIFTIMIPNKKVNKELDKKEKLDSKIIALELNPKNIAKNLELENIEQLIAENGGKDYMDSKVENINLLENENR